MNEYEAKIPALIQMALQNGATVTDLERILGEKAQKYLYDSGVVQKPTAEETPVEYLNNLANLGMGVPNEGERLGVNLSDADSPESLPEPSFWEKHFGGKGQMAMNPYSQAKDMSNYATIPSLFSMSNQIQRQNRNQRVAQQPPQNRYIQSLLGG